MDPTSIAQIAVKVSRYLPFLTAGVLLTLCKTTIAPRSVRAAGLLGLGFGLGMVGWILRYFLEQVAPSPVYDIQATAMNILSVAAPSVAYDILASGGLVLAYIAIARAVHDSEAGGGSEGRSAVE